MKVHLLFLTCLCLSFATQAQQTTFKLPLKSPNQTIIQDIGLGKISVTYSRPGVKGRTMLGRYLPYDSLWRTGANGATRIWLTVPMQIGPAQLDSGSYSLYTIPGKTTWTIILNKGAKNYGTYDYKKADDIARFTVPAMTSPMMVETMAFQFENVKPDACDLQLSWEKWMIRIPIKQDIAQALKASAELAQKTEKPPYEDLAEYYHYYAKDYAKAVEMADKGLALYEAKKQKPYWLYLEKARILKDKGDLAGARKASETSIKQAQEEKDSDYVRQNKELNL